MEKKQQHKNSRLHSLAR